MAMSISSNPQFDQTAITAVGLEIVALVQRSLQVARTGPDEVTLSVVQTGQDSILFRLTNAQAGHLAALLTRDSVEGMPLSPYAHDTLADGYFVSPFSGVKYRCPPRPPKPQATAGQEG